MVREIKGTFERVGSDMPVAGSLDDKYVRSGMRDQDILERLADSRARRVVEESLRNARNTRIVGGFMAAAVTLIGGYLFLKEPVACGHSNDGPFTEDRLGMRTPVPGTAFKTDRAQGICVTATGDILKLNP